MGGAPKERRGKLVARSILTTRRDALSKSETVRIAAIEEAVPLLVEARAIIGEFHAILRKKAKAELDSWIERARVGLVASFARYREGQRHRSRRDRFRVVQRTERQITKLKLVKRQMYERAKLGLREERLIGAN